MRWAILAIVALGLCSEAAGQSVTVSGIYAGFPHNVQDTRVFNGSWTVGAPSGGKQVTVSLTQSGARRVSFWLQASNGTWHSSFTVEVPAGSNVYEHRSYIYPPFGGAPIGELYPPVYVQIN